MTAERGRCVVCNWCPWAHDRSPLRARRVVLTPAGEWWCAFCCARLGDPRQLELPLLDAFERELERGTLAGTALQRALLEVPR